jgi:hypothetical protein
MCILLSVPAVPEGLETFLQRHLGVWLRSDQRAETASCIVVRRMFKQQLRLSNVLLLGYVWSGLCSSLQSR